MYYVYWDVSCQCELTRVTAQQYEDREAIAELEDMIGGGNYFWYPIPEGFKLVKSKGRNPNYNTKLQLTLEEEN